MNKPTDKIKKEEVEAPRIVANRWQEDFSAFDKLKDDEKMPVLILGQTGTGKELIAERLHSIDRPGRPFVPQNCALIDKELMESKLFGHVRGAFTGAVATKEGVFQEAADGTLFLDEFQELCPSAQASLLRAVEQREVKRMGGSRMESVRCRIILASSKDLSSEDNLRPDLYYRVSKFRIFLSPLYQRGAGILVLTRYFVERFNENITAINGELLLLIMTWKWPGNVRELSNFLYPICRLADNNVLRLTEALMPEYRNRLTFDRWSEHSMGPWFSSRLRSVEENNPSELKKVISCRRTKPAERFILEPWRRYDEFGNPMNKIMVYDDIPLKLLPQHTAEEILEMWGNRTRPVMPPHLQDHYDALRHWYFKVKEARDLMNAAEERYKETSAQLSNELVSSQNPKVTFEAKFPEYDEAKSVFDNQYNLELQKRYGPSRIRMARIAGKERKWVYKRFPKSRKD